MLGNIACKLSKTELVDIIIIFVEIGVSTHNLRLKTIEKCHIQSQKS